MAVFCPTRIGSHETHNRCNLYVEEITKPRLSCFAFILLFISITVASPITPNGVGYEATIEQTFEGVPVITNGIPLTFDGFPVLVGYYEYPLADGTILHLDTTVSTGNGWAGEIQTVFYSTPADDPAQATPEPSTALLFMIGVPIAAFIRRRFR